MARISTRSQGNTALLCARDTETMRALLEAGADVNAVNPAGYTLAQLPMHPSARFALVMDYGLFLDPALCRWWFPCTYSWACEDRMGVGRMVLGSLRFENIARMVCAA